MSVFQESAPGGKRAHRIAPRFFILAARITPVLILGQFLLAGLSLFQNAAIWEWHATVGFLAFIPVAAMLVSTLTLSSVRPLRWWAGITMLLYIVQVILAVAGEGTAILQALHPFNGALLLVSSLVIVAKVEHSHRG